MEFRRTALVLCCLCLGAAWASPLLDGGADVPEHMRRALLQGLQQNCACSW